MTRMHSIELQEDDQYWPYTAPQVWKSVVHVLLYSELKYILLVLLFPPAAMRKQQDKHNILN